MVVVTTTAISSRICGVGTIADATDAFPSLWMMLLL